nr:serine/arginine-rich SC35-like splicing factor SCL33 [Globicephala melas]
MAAASAAAGSPGAAGRGFRGGRASPPEVWGSPERCGPRRGSGPRDRWVPPTRPLRQRGLVPSPRTRRSLRGSESSAGASPERADSLSRFRSPGVPRAGRLPPPRAATQPRPRRPNPARISRRRLCVLTPSLGSSVRNSG